MSTEKFQLIYADPPWKYEYTISNSRKIENQYPIMELEEIKKMEVPSDDNCALFLWTTAPKLAESLEVMESWGFIYRTCLIWDKMSIGMGYWFRNQHEILLVGVKGKISPPPVEMRVSSVFRQKKGNHSEKPTWFKTLLSKWYPSLKKIELFSRDRFEGWEAFGNEVGRETQTLLKKKEVV